MQLSKALSFFGSNTEYLKNSMYRQLLLSYILEPNVLKNYLSIKSKKDIKTRVNNLDFFTRSIIEKQKRV